MDKLDYHQKLASNLLFDLAVYATDTLSASGQDSATVSTAIDQIEYADGTAYRFVQPIYVEVSVDSQLNRTYAVGLTDAEVQYTDCNAPARVAATMAFLAMLVS